MPFTDQAVKTTEGRMRILNLVYTRYLTILTTPQLNCIR